MASDFERAFELVIGAEGGYVNDPDDPGGETKYGVCKRDYPHLDIKNLQLKDAHTIAYDNYWAKAHCDLLPWPISAFVFDAAYNQGPDPAIRMLQKTLDVAQDGLFGPQTKRAVSKMNKEKAALYMADRSLRYTGTRNFDKYGRGWFKRLFILAMEAAK